MLKTISIYACMLLLSMTIFGQNNDLTIEKKKYTTQRSLTKIKVDGILNDEAWNQVEWADDFIQNRPNEGQPPSQKTAFKVLYDDKHLYFAYRCEDTSPDSIIRRMSRRDEFPGDWVEVNIDSYHDLRTGFSFTISASGVRGDEFISNNGENWESSWNPIWFAKTTRDDKGWYAEVAIPFSQLRFGKEKNKVWGLQVQRRLFRKEERAIWQYIPQKTGVWVSGFGELHGLENIQPKKQVEVAPYTVAKLEKYVPEAGNPFATGLDKKVTVGVDGKIALTSDIILDYTINPDFGQVEADPSQVRIDGYQNFFQERRPFFIESRNIFDYQLTGSAVGDDYDADILFYSRRIGSAPHGNIHQNTGSYVSLPSATPILAAIKLSGKTSKGWSIGLLESITKNVYGKKSFEGKLSDHLIEPLASYSVGRLQKDFNGGQTVIGGIVTMVNRQNDLNNLLHKSAYSGGIDFQHFWNNRTWSLKANMAWSKVIGSREKILETQQAFEHLFQRTNATEVYVDTSLTQLNGTAATIKIGKFGGKAGKWGQVFKFETGVTYRSPGFETNDIGFLLSANEINHFTWAGLQFQQPVGAFRQARINFNNISRWDFGGQYLLSWFNTNLHGTFQNNWGVGTGFNWLPYALSNTALRGGPSMRLSARYNNWFYVESDNRKKWAINLQGFNGFGTNKSAYDNNYTLGLRIQPINALSISANISYGLSERKQDQFATIVDYNGKSRYIVSALSQKTTSMTLRLTYNITPDLTLQYYGQPFITRPLYYNFAYVKDADNPVFDERFHIYSQQEINTTENGYSVDEDQDGVQDYSFASPDFNFVQFRSNLILRWEYKAGSELYLVWSQNNSPDAFADLSSPLFTSLTNNAFGDQGRNIFLMKATYRFVR